MAIKGLNVKIPPLFLEQNFRYLVLYCEHPIGDHV